MSSAGAPPGAFIRNGQVVATPWWHAYSPMKLINLIVLFFQTLTSPESAAVIRARRGKPTAPPKPSAMGRPPASNVRTLNMRDCGAGG